MTMRFIVFKGLQIAQGIGQPPQLALFGVERLRKGLENFFRSHYWLQPPDTH